MLGGLHGGGDLPGHDDSLRGQKPVPCARAPRFDVSSMNERSAPAPALVPAQTSWNEGRAIISQKIATEIKVNLKATMSTHH